MTYTCQDYRTEMILLGLRLQLNQKDLEEEERKKIVLQIKKLEAEMEFE